LVCCRFLLFDSSFLVSCRAQEFVIAQLPREELSVQAQDRLDEPLPVALRETLTTERVLEFAAGELTLEDHEATV
jgi:hypothetical protein